MAASEESLRINYCHLVTAEAKQHTASDDALQGSNES